MFMRQMCGNVSLTGRILRRNTEILNVDALLILTNLFTVLLYHGLIIDNYMQH